MTHAQPKDASADDERILPTKSENGIMFIIWAKHSVILCPGKRTTQKRTLMSDCEQLAAAYFAAMAIVGAYVTENQNKQSIGKSNAYLFVIECHSEESFVFCS